MTLKSMAFDPTTGELTCKWCGMVSALFREEKAFETRLHWELEVCEDTQKNTPPLTVENYLFQEYLTNVYTIRQDLHRKHIAQRVWET